VLRLKTFGGLSLEGEHGPLTGAAAQRRRLAVLAVLAAYGARGITRDKLIGLLWPEVDETRARAALSQSVYALKRDTGEDQLVLGHDVLALNPLVVTSDVAEFEDAVGRDDDALAANLYVGPFLDGVFLPDAPDFEHWIDGIRLRLGQAAERVLERLAGEAEDRKDYVAAADWWRRLTAIDPLKTRAVLGLMGALAESGDRAAALRHAERYAERVREDLDGEPSAAVTELADTLRGQGDRERFVDRFVIDRELGRGGMAVVYLARDTKHDRNVALKMLRADMSAAIGRERFEREIRVTAGLQHPHILPLHDSGEWGDGLFYVMPYVDGESLRTRLNRERKLSIGDALLVAQEVAEALSHAHRRGVVHRDVKPENILLADGHAIVADFGIARVVSHSLDPQFVQAGISVGTPAYMAPEQISGEGDEGPLCDVFSLGCVLFEMLAGRPPWIGATPSSVLARRLKENAPTLRALRPDVPPWLAELVRDMLADEPSRRPGSASEVVRLLATGGSTVQSLLPDVADEMIGRDAELHAVASLLDRPDVRLLTLTGAGGTGKTRLAIHAARELEPHVDRVAFVDLASLNDPTRVAPAIAAAIGVQPESGRDLIDAIASANAGRRTLLVLDNFEQVVSAASTVAQLVAAAPTMKMLITSRTRLGIRAEHEFFVAPLSLPDPGADASALRDNPAVRLFIRRASAANAALVFDEEALAAAAKICSRIDGLPLAIELAAARCRLMSPRVIAARIASGFELVSGTGRDLPARHQTIREAVRWSVALLTPSERSTFGRMAIFAGGCTVDAAESVCAEDGRPSQPFDDLSALVDASLLMRDMTAGETEPRLRMLETVREVALDEHSRSGDPDAVGRRHAEWYLRLATSFAPRLTGESQHEALTTLAHEHANFGVALDWMIRHDDADGALALGAALWRYWLVRGHLAEGRSWLARVLAMPAATRPELDASRADVMTGAGHIAQNTGAVGEAEQHFQAVLEMRRHVGDEPGVARALADLGWIAWRQCDFPKARRLSAECLTLAERIGATRVAALALTNLGAAALFEGALAEARAAFARSSVLRAEVADRRGVAFADTFLAWATCRAGNLDQALALLEGAEETLRSVGDQRLVYFARDIRAETFIRHGDPASAAAILEIDSMAGVRRFGDRWSVAHGLAVASWASHALGRYDRAVAFATESLQLRRAEGDRYGEAECLALLAAAARATGDETIAVGLLRESRDIRSAIGDAAGLAECDAELAQMAAPA
jgi:predicted ATPase/DNA-binding SARP family transcriptional activator/tRNA A-37 threonylcarbamoyl transferase component Bud32